MLSLHLTLTLSFENRFRMLTSTVTTQQANAYSPWTPRYYY